MIIDFERFAQLNDPNQVVVSNRFIFPEKKFYSALSGCSRPLFNLINIYIYIYYTYRISADITF